QPALTTAIQKLERELNAELLVRGSRPLRPTTAGKLAGAAARELGVVSGSLRARIAELAGQRPSITLGMIDSVAGMLFSGAPNIEDMEQRANLSIVVSNSRILRRGVERGEIDIAFITEPPNWLPEPLHSSPVAGEPLVLVCHTAQAPRCRDDLRDGQL